MKNIEHGYQKLEESIYLMVQIARLKSVIIMLALEK